MLQLKTPKNTLVLFPLVAFLGLILSFCTTQTENGKRGSETKTGSHQEPTVGGCEVDDFSSWFVTGTVNNNGLVKPPNSVDGPFESNCDFYKWSWQNFLWQTSPTDKSYVFDSSPFYDLEGDSLVEFSSMKKVRGGKETETGQAGQIHFTLLSQNQPKVTPDGSLVYYAIHVNDVYAYFVSGKNQGSLAELTEFPTTQEELEKIKEYALEEYQDSIKSNEVLTLELKSSWVKVDPKNDLSTYITLKADVQKYVHQSDQEWTWDGVTLEKDVTLALVGYHIVGSVKGNPEMVWATFEHKDNTANANYYYLNEKGEPTEKVNFKNGSLVDIQDWLFTNAETKEETNNIPNAELVGNNIKAASGQTISASSTIRVYPYGNETSKSGAKNNTEIISLNEQIQGMLKGNDVRKNYFLVGAVWTQGGVIPQSNKTNDPVFEGSPKLTNSTMETYFENTNCFSCHNGGKLGGLSHIFDKIDPLTK